MPSIELNHIWTVIDRTTYDAIKNEPFIKSFAHCYEQANTADAQTGWEGFYIRGKNTFIELFYPQERYKNVGLSGIGLGFDHHGHLKEYFQAFKRAFPIAEYQSFTRNGAAWFDYIAVNGSYYGEGHSLWIMEYSQEYFSENKSDVSRKHYNQTSYNTDGLLEDISGFVIALPPNEQKTLSAYLSQSGMKETKHNIFTNKSGISIQIIDESLTQKGICQIKLNLNKPVRKLKSLSLGNSRLEFDGQTAFWHFTLG